MSEQKRFFEVDPKYEPSTEEEAIRYVTNNLGIFANLAEEEATKLPAETKEKFESGRLEFERIVALSKARGWNVDSINESLRTSRREHGASFEPTF